MLWFASCEGPAAVEVMCWPVGRADCRFVGVTHINVASLTATRTDEIRGLFRKHGVDISGLGCYSNMLDPDPAVSEPAVEHI